jgi:hypothetical protein
VAGLLAHVYDGSLAPATDGGASITEVERQEALQNDVFLDAMTNDAQFALRRVIEKFT